MTPHTRPRPRLPAPGFGLAELLLTLGAAAAMGGAALFFYPRVQTRVHVATDVENLRAMASAIDRSYGVVGTYRSVSASSVVEDNLVPSDFRKASSGSGLTNAWGGSVAITPSTVRRFGDSFTVAFSGVPRRACVPFLSAVAGDAYVQDVRVDGTSAKWNTGGQLDVPTLAVACQEGGNVLEVVYYSGLASGGSVATVIEPAAPVPSPFLDAPTTPTGPVASAPSVDDALPGNPVTPSPGGLPPVPPAVPALPPAAATPLVPQPSPIGPPPTLPPALVPCQQAESFAQTGTCPVGTWGTETLRSRSVCPDEGVDPNADVAWEHPEAWAQPVVVTKTIASNCQACPGSGVQQNTQWVGTSQACPSGQVGAHKWEREQRSERSVSYNCPAGTISLPAPTLGGWSEWADTGGRRNEVNTCVSSVPRCADGSLQVAAWYSAVVDDLPPPPGSTAVGYWYYDSVVPLTPAEKARLHWAIQNVPVTRTETPAPMPGNWPANVSESASYAEQCNALGDVGNINYAYSYDFECVSNMGMHYCDYNWTGGGTSMAVCRQACASDLVGKSNNPYRWEWPESSVVASTPSTTCTGQPGCTPNGGFGTQQGLPACNEHNVSQSIAFNWYRQFYNPVRVDYQALTLTCRGPTA